MSPIIVIIGWILWAALGAIGLRLLLQARRIRALPELLVGLYFLGGTVIGHGPILVFLSLPELKETAPDVVYWINVVSRFGISTAPMILGLFAWRVFRPQDRRAAIAAVTIALVAVVTACIGVGSPSAELAQKQPLVYWLAVLSSATAYTWCSLEAFVNYRSGRKRVALGLSDPIVINRFLLWAIWSGVCVVLSSANVAGVFASGGTLKGLALTVVSIVYLTGGVVNLVVVWLIFVPPRFYRTRISSFAAA
jgi:hypothetical protein